jgi:chemotaxis protein methyltransferase CheR
LWDARASGELEIFGLQRMLTSEQFDRTRRLALRSAGIELVGRHHELLCRRGHRFGLRDGAEFQALLDAAEAGDHEAGQRLIRLITTGFTNFFRHPSQFELAARRAQRAVSERGNARLWSCAVATGEEAYSLAISLLELFQCDAPPMTILASDLNEEALEVAQRGEYSQTAVRGLEPARRARFFIETPAHRWSVVPAVRHLVEFRSLNLASKIWSTEGSFDVIFCRNVLMYLETACRHAVLERIASLLAPKGLLMLDPTEHLGRAAHLFSPAGEGVYAGRPLPGHAAPREVRLRRIEL